LIQFFIACMLPEYRFIYTDRRIEQIVGYAFYRAVVGIVLMLLASLFSIICVVMMYVGRRFSDQNGNGNGNGRFSLARERGLNNTVNKKLAIQTVDEPQRSRTTHTVEQQVVIPKGSYIVETVSGNIDSGYPTRTNTISTGAANSPTRHNGHHNHNTMAHSPRSHNSGGIESGRYSSHSVETDAAAVLPLVLTDPAKNPHVEVVRQLPREPWHRGDVKKIQFTNI